MNIEVFLTGFISDSLARTQGHRQKKGSRDFTYWRGSRVRLSSHPLTLHAKRGNYAKSEDKYSPTTKNKIHYEIPEMDNV